MFKQFMNTGSLNSLMLFENEGAVKTPTEIAREAIVIAREAIAKNTTVSHKSEKEVKAEAEKAEEETKDEDLEETEEEEEEETTEENEEEKEEETVEEKTAREAKEVAEAKAARKDARIQKRIDTAVAAQKKAEAEVVALKAQLEANPDQKLTEAEVIARAEAIANEKITQANMERLQLEFNKTCDKLQEDAIKLDKEFTPKVVAMTNELGPIPSRIIGILADIENGAEVLSLMANDIDEAEKLYDLKDKPEKLTIAIVRMADKLAEAKKPKVKPLSKVPNQGEQIKPSRVNSNTITGKESTEDYIRKRVAQREELKKVRGY
jgi:hypothetical protein